MIYDVSNIKQAIKNAGGKNIRTSKLNGWSNQPDVVTFSANIDDLRAIREEASAELGGLAAEYGLITVEKDW